MFRSPFVIVLWAVVTWFIVTFLIVPNVSLLIETFGNTGQRSALDKLASSAAARRSLVNSFLLAVLLTITVNIVGVFIVLVTRFYKVKGSRYLWAAYATTFLYGGVVLVSGYKAIYGEGGILEGMVASIIPGFSQEWFTGLAAVLFVMTFSCTTNHLLFLTSAVDNLDQQALEAAELMGSSQWHTLWRVVIPQLKPTLFATTILTFLTGLSALSAPQLIGGRQFQTISPMILTFARSATSRDIAALLALILGVATLIMLALMNRLEKSGTYFSVARVTTPLKKQRITNPVGNAVVHAVAYVLGAIYLFPVLVIVAMSFVRPADLANGTFGIGSFTVENYVRVLGRADSLQPFLVSVAYGAATAIIVTVGLIFIARYLQRYDNWVTRLTEYLLHIPWVLPSTMIALGILLTFDVSTPLLFGQVLTGTVYALLACYIIGKIPFTLRMFKAAFAGVNTSMEEAAALMGAGTLAVFRRILLPAVLPVAAAVTVLNFNSLLDDYDSAVFLATPRQQPLGVVIAANTQSEINLDAASNTFVYTVVLMVITGLTMWLVYGRLLASPEARAGGGGKRAKHGKRLAREALAATTAASGASSAPAPAAAAATPPLPTSTPDPTLKDQS